MHQGGGRGVYFRSLGVEVLLLRVEFWLIRRILGLSEYILNFDPLAVNF